MTSAHNWDLLTGYLHVSNPGPIRGETTALVRCRINIWSTIRCDRGQNMGLQSKIDLSAAGYTIAVDSPWQLGINVQAARPTHHTDPTMC